MMLWRHGGFCTSKGCPRGHRLFAVEVYARRLHLIDLVILGEGRPRARGR